MQPLINNRLKTHPFKSISYVHDGAVIVICSPITETASEPINDLSDDTYNFSVLCWNFAKEKIMPRPHTLWERNVYVGYRFQATLKDEWDPEQFQSSTFSLVFWSWVTTEQQGNSMWKPKTLLLAKKTNLRQKTDLKTHKSQCFLLWFTFREKLRRASVTGPSPKLK